MGSPCLGEEAGPTSQAPCPAVPGSPAFPAIPEDSSIRGPASQAAPRGLDRKRRTQAAAVKVSSPWGQEHPPCKCGIYTPGCPLASLPVCLYAGQQFWATRAQQMSWAMPGNGWLWDSPWLRAPPHGGPRRDGGGASAVAWPPGGRGWGATLAGVDWGPSGWTLAICLEFPPPAPLATWLRDSRGQTRTTRHQPAVLSAYLASPRFCPGPVPFYETVLTFLGRIVEPCYRPEVFL